MDINGVMARVPALHIDPVGMNKEQLRLVASIKLRLGLLFRLKVLDLFSIVHEPRLRDQDTNEFLKKFECVKKDLKQCNDLCAVKFKSVNTVKHLSEFLIGVNEANDLLTSEKFDGLVTLPNGKFKYEY
jgi:hypothetical protein